MLKLKAKIRKDMGKKVKNLRKKDILPGVLYGPKVKNQALEVNLREFKEILKEAGESSLLSLEVGKDKFSVLIHDVKKDPLTEEPVHVDFYQPILTEKVEATVPIVFEGEALAVKELGGTMIKEIQEVEVEALPQNLPHEIKVNVDGLETFEDEILIKDLKIAEGVKILKEPNEIVVNVVPPEKVEEELEKPVEEKVEEVEKVEEKGEEGRKETKEEEKPPSAEAAAGKEEKSSK